MDPHLHQLVNSINNPIKICTVWKIDAVIKHVQNKDRYFAMNANTYIIYDITGTNGVFGRDQAHIIHLVSTAVVIISENKKH